ncbi:unnamed protein product [Caenorhabditis brenneri]
MSFFSVDPFEENVPICGFAPDPRVHQIEKLFHKRKFSAPPGENRSTKANDSALLTTENVKKLDFKSDMSTQILMPADTWSDTTSPLKSHESSPIRMVVSSAHSEEVMVISSPQWEEMMEIPLPQSEEVVWVPPPQVVVQPVMMRSEMPPKLVPAPAREQVPQPVSQMAPKPTSELAPKPDPKTARQTAPQPASEQTTQPASGKRRPSTEEEDPAQKKMKSKEKLVQQLLQEFWEESDAYNHSKALPARIPATLGNPPEELHSENELFLRRYEEKRTRNEEMRIRLPRLNEWEQIRGIQHIVTKIDELDFFLADRHKKYSSGEEGKDRKTVCARRIRHFILVFYCYMDKEFRERRNVPKFARWFHRAIVDICWKCTYMFWLNVDAMKIYTVIHELAKTFDPTIEFKHFTINIKQDDWVWKAPYPEHLEVLKRLATEKFERKDIV